MPNKKKTFRQFLEDLDTIGRSVEMYADVVFASQCFHVFHAVYSKMALERGYIKKHGGIWIVTTAGDNFI